MYNEKRLLKELYVHRERCVNLLLSKTNCDRDTAENVFIEAVFTYKKKVTENNLPDRKIHISSYLYGICHNLWLKSYASEKKLKDSAGDVARYFYEYLPDSINSISAKMYQENLLHVMQDSLKSMGDKCRSIIKLFYYEDKTMTEIAEIMNFKTSIVATTAKYRCFKEFRDRVLRAKRKQEITDF